MKLHYYSVSRYFDVLGAETEDPAVGTASILAFCLQKLHLVAIVAALAVETSD